MFRKFWHFLSSAETWRYLHWRWRQNKLAFFLVPWQWLGTVFAIWLERWLAYFSTLVLYSKPRIGHSSSTPIVFLIEPSEIPRRKLVAQHLYPQQVAKLIGDADLICGDRLPLATNIELDFSLPNWRLSLADAEHLFSLNRWLYGVTLAKAWVYQQDVRYVQRWHQLFVHWVEANPPKENDPIWESYSVSERIVNWCLCACWFWDAPEFEEKFFPLLTQTLAIHAQWLYGHIEIHSAHNHLINNARALYLYGVGFDVGFYRTWAWVILERELFRQTLPDGMLGEQSTHYHLLLTRTYIEVLLAAQKIHQPVSINMLRRVQLMIRVAQAFIRPDGSLPIVGDFSPDTNVENLAGVIEAGAARLIDGYRPDIRFLTENGIWWMDIGNELEKSNSRGVAPSIYLPQAGYWLCQQHLWHILFVADPRGHVIRHGHVDALSLCIWHDGYELLIDSGNFTYQSDEWANYFRSARAHNLFMIDDAPPMLNGSGWQRLLDYDEARVQWVAPQQFEHWYWASAAHQGYQRLAHGVNVRRRVLVSNDYIWITDWAEGMGTHILTVCWHWGENEVTHLQDGQWQIAKARWSWLVNGVAATPTLAKGLSSPEIQGWYSPSYGKQRAGTTMVLRQHFKSKVRSDALLWCGDELFETFIANEKFATVITCDWRETLSFGTAGQLMVSREKR